MKNEHKVLLLTKSDDPELLDIFTKAFSKDPHMPILCEKPNATIIVIKNLLFVYGGIKSTIRYGIKENNKLVCASVNIDSSVNNTFLIGFRFILSLFHASGFRGIGLRCMKEFLLAWKEKPAFKDTYLEILLMGTFPKYQKKGFGKEMLQFLYKEAKRRNYRGLIGFTRADRPAFQLYIKHGWIVDKEFIIRDKKFCWIRFMV